MVFVRKLYLIFVFQRLVLGARGGLWTNWGETVSSSYLSWTDVSSERELINAVEQANTNLEDLSVIGSGHSSRALAPTSGHMVQLDGFNKLVSVNPPLFTFQSGIRCRAVLEILEQHGYTLEGVGRQIVQSLGGAVQTNTHGTGDIPGMSTMIESMNLVLPNGTSIFVSSQSNSDLFNAAKVGLGMIGIISTITIRAVPAFNIRRDVYFYTIGDIVPLMRAIHDRYDILHDRVRIAFSDLGQVSLETYTVTNDPVFPEGGCWNVDPLENCTDIAFRASSVPEQLPASPPQPMHEALIPIEYEYEFVTRWLELLRTVLAPLIAFVDVSSAVRYVGSDDLWMSPMNGRRVVAILMTLSLKEGGRPEHFDPFREALCDLAFEYKGRMHWGEESVYTKEQVRSLYPSWNLFLAERQLADPNGMFLNDYTRHVFSLEK